VIINFQLVWKHRELNKKSTAIPEEQKYERLFSPAPKGQKQNRGARR